MEVKLANVVTTFPVGTTVGLYADWRTDSGEPTPVGAALSEAVVDANGDLTFTEVPEGRRVLIAAAQVDGDWHFRGVTIAAAGTDPATQAAVEAVQAALSAHEALTQGVHGIAAPTASLLVIVEHGADPAVARPEADFVEWHGSVEPENMAAGKDTWRVFP